MYKSLLIYLSIFLVGCATSSNSTTPIDQIPMYGGHHRASIPELKAADDALIKGTSDTYGNRENASNKFVDQAFRYYFANDTENAMRRFNQAWILNSQNPDVFQGFSSVLNDWGDYCEASKMIERSFVLGLEREARNLADSGRVFALCSASDALTNVELKIWYRDQSQQSFSEAHLKRPNDPYIYGHQASADYWLGDYESAWRNIKKQQILGGQRNQKFIDLLSEKMPDPENQ